MKKTFLFLVVFFSIIMLAEAKQVDEQQAKSVGQKFLKSTSSWQTLKQAPELVLAYRAICETEPSKDHSTVNVSYYVFNSTTPSGFVIVSGDDRIIPILGYSGEHPFSADQLPPQVKAWLDDYSKQVSFAISHDLPATEKIQAAWDQLSGTIGEAKSLGKPAGVGALLQTQWDQAPNYNADCPMDYGAGQLTVTGCVATAMAQVMRYWSYPPTGSGFHSYNTNSYGTLSADFANTTYNWSSMPNTISAPNSAIAKLMYHCGVSVDMSYGVGATGGSSAYLLSAQSPVTNCSEYALKTYFGYPASMSGAVRLNYSENSWVNLLKSELDAHRPILYAGFGSGGGHCFVCDGYDDNGYFHFNWGWSGYCDGYFQINALNPGGVGAGGGTGGYNSGHQALIGIQAPQGGGGQNASMKLYAALGVSSTTLGYGEPFTVTTDILNYGTTSFTGDYCAAVFDNSGVFVDFIEQYTGQTLPAGYHYNNGITFSSNGLLTMLPGNYVIAVYYKVTGGNWIQVEDGSYNNLVEVSVINNNNIALYAPMNITPGNTLTRGQPISVHLDVGNYGNVDFTGIIDVSLYNLDGSFAFTINQVTNANLPQGTHFTDGLTFTNSNVDVEPGTYLLATQHKFTSGNWELTGSTNYQNPVIVTVLSPDMVPDIYEPNNSVVQAYNLPLSYSGHGALITTSGANCHIGSDYDLYKIVLDPGYSYTIAVELFNANYQGNDPTHYTLAGIFSCSVDEGNTWTDIYNGVLPNNLIVNNGGTVYFYVSPQFTGQTGTYLLRIGVDKNSLGIGNQQEDEKITIYPIPAKDHLTIDLGSQYLKNNTVRIISSSGKIMDTWRSEKRIMQVDLKDYPDGLYFLQIQLEQGLLSRKFTVSK
ncbi:MAG: C10 family peptidase [Bacteroidota bacterium]